MTPAQRQVPLEKLFRLKRNDWLTPGVLESYYAGQSSDKIPRELAISSFSPRRIGIEIEMERAPQQAFVWFTTDEDGSLRDNGLEIKSIGPVGGAAIDATLAEYENYLKKYKTVKFTHRCSIHVHVNVRDYTLDQLQAMFMSYVCLEELFFSEVDELRKNNSYCYSVADSIIGTTWGGIQELCDGNNSTKYMAMNIGTSRSFGTVEFRHLEGTKDIDKLSHWIKLVQTFVDYFAKADPKEVINSILDLNSNSHFYQFILNIFDHNPWPTADLKPMMEQNIAIAKRMI